jgi:hypothetical protein
MPAVETPLTIEQGVSWSHGWRVTYNGNPIDATWTAAAQVRKQANPTSPLLYTFAASVDETGAVVLGVPYADSEAWDWDYGHYDVEVTNADATVRLRVARGAVRVSREVTTSV